MSQKQFTNTFMIILILTICVSTTLFSSGDQTSYQLVVAHKKEVDFKPIQELSKKIQALEQSTQQSMGMSSSKKITHELSLVMNACTTLILSNPQQAQLAENNNPAQLQFLLHLGTLETIEDLTTDIFNNNLELPDNITLDQLNSITQKFIDADELHQSKLFEYAKALASILTIIYQDQEEIVEAIEDAKENIEPKKNSQKIHEQLYESIKNFLKNTLPNYLWELISINEVAISYGCAVVLPYLMTNVHNLSLPLGAAAGASFFASVYISREHLLQTKLLKICYTGIILGAVIAYCHHFNGIPGPEADFIFDYPTGK